MNENVYERLRDISLENFLYFVALVELFIEFYANEDLKRSFCTGEDVSERNRRLYIIGAYLLLFVFLAFAIRNYNSWKKINPYEKPREYKVALGRVIGSFLFVFGQLLIINYLYKAEVIDGSPL